MNRQMAKTFALAAFALAVVPGTWRAQALDAKTPYPSMAPLDQYLMPDRNAEIALTRTAAPILFRTMQRSWFSGGMATKPQSKARTVLCAWWNDHGPLESTTRIFGIQSYELRSASIRRPRDPIFHSLSGKPI